MKVAVISGASGEIGSNTAKLFVKNGFFTVALYNSNVSGIENLKAQLKEENLDGYLFPVKADFNNVSEVYTAFSLIEKNFNHIDVLVNNAGVGLYKLITETCDDAWDKVFNVNVKSAYVLTKLALKSMIDRKSGKIVNVSSIWGKDGASMESCYSASKSALIGFTKALAKEVGPSGINVNCVCPGVIDTKMNARFSKEEMQDLIYETPLLRLGKASEIAELIYFLSSEKANFITGQIITADGGFTL